MCNLRKLYLFRAELVLADLRKKKIIPLLLEKIGWPPAGPMAIKLAPLIYFEWYLSEAAVQNNCPDFKQLEKRIRRHVSGGQVFLKLLVRYTNIYDMTSNSNLFVLMFK